MGGLLHLLRRGDPAHAPHRYTKRNSPRPPSTASVPTIVLLYNGLLLCGFSCGPQMVNRVSFYVLTTENVYGSGELLQSRPI